MNPCVVSEKLSVQPECKEGEEFPIPSRLDEQARIVQILDVFDALVNDLSIGLPAELAARRAVRVLPGQAVDLQGA